MFTTAVPHAEAAAVLEGKPAVTRAVFDELLPELQARAFVITGVDSADALQAARDAIATVPRGEDWRKVKKEITAALDPWLGEQAERRVELVMRHHAYHAYAVTNVRYLLANTDLFPYWQYMTAQDSKVRDTHAALNGIVLPWDSPFWDRHTPPWDYGCRCNVRGVPAGEADEIREADAGKDAPKRRVLEGPAKEKLEREGRLERGPNEIFDVRTASERGETGPEWSSKDLKIPLDALKDRYDADVWKRFTDWADGVEIDAGPGKENFTVWEWLSSSRRGGAEVQDRPDSAAALLSRVLGGKPRWGRAEAASLFDRLRVDEPRPTEELIDFIDVRWESPGLDGESVRGYVDDVVRRLPRELSDQLPPLRIFVEGVKIPDGQTPWLGRYRDGVLALNSHTIESIAEARETAYHELMHWIVEESDSAAYRARIAAHFQARTAAGAGWVDERAGRIYDWEDPANPGGIEVPPLYFQRFADPEHAADALEQDPETMELVLSLFFP